MAAPRYATVHYRKFVPGGISMPLATAVANALTVTDGGVRYGDDWQRRVEKIPTDPPQSRFINNIHSDGPTIFGTLCVYSEHQMQAMIDSQSHAANVDISDAQAPAGADYLHGIAYWLIIDDHCYIVQHPRATSKTLESYLTWLLHKVKMLQGNQTVFLRSEFDVAIVGDPDEIMSIEVGGLAAETGKDHEYQVTTQEVEERRLLDKVKPTLTKASAVLESLFGSIGAEQIIGAVPTGAALDVTVNIGYRSRRRKIDRSGLRDIGTRLRHLEDGQVKIRGRNGTTQGDDARLHLKMPFRLIRPNGNLLELGHARSQLRKVHDRFLDDGKIEAGE